MSESKNNIQLVLNAAYESISELERARELATVLIPGYGINYERMEAWELVAHFTARQATHAQEQVALLKEQRKPKVTIKYHEPHPMRCIIKCKLCGSSSYIRAIDTIDTINNCRTCKGDIVDYGRDTGEAVTKESVLADLISVEPV